MNEGIEQYPLVPKQPAPVDGQANNSHPVLFADDFLFTATQKLDFLLERGCRCVAVILQNKSGDQQKIDRWGKVVIVEEQPTAQDIKNALEDRELLRKIYDAIPEGQITYRAVVDILRAYRAAVKERLQKGTP